MSTASGVPEAQAPARRSDVQIVRYEKYIDNELRKTRRQVRMVDLTWGGMALLTGALAYLFAVALVDQWVVSGGLGHGARAVALFLFLAGAIGWIAWAVAPLLFRRINPIYAANAIEQARPSLKNGLVNFMMLRGHPESISPAVFAQIEKQAATGLSQAPLENTVDRSHLLKLAYVLLGIVAVLAIYKVASPKDPIRSVRRVLAPWADIAAPTRVRINDVDPRNASAFHGRFVKVSAEITGLRRDEAPQLFFSTADGQVVGQSISMNVPPAELRHAAELPPNQGGLQQDMEFWIVAGDATTPRYPIHVLTTPSIVVDKVEIRPPAYTEIEGYTVERQGDLSAIEGTEVVIHATANEDIKTAAIDFDCNGTRDVQMQVDGRVATVKFPLAMKKNGEGPEHASYQLRFTNNDGEENPEPVRYKIDVTPDRAPEVVFTAPIAKDDELQTIQPNELLNLVVRAADPDFKLKDVKLVIERNALSLVSQSLLPQPQQSTDGPPFLLDGAKLKLKPGDKLEYWAEAIDNKLPTPNRTLTSKRQLRVAALDPKQRNPKAQRGAEGDPNNANAGDDPNQKREPQKDQKNDPKRGRDGEPRRQPDRPNNNEPAQEPSTNPRPEDNALDKRDTVDNPRGGDRENPPEDPANRGKTNKEPKADRDPSKPDDNDPQQQKPQDGADQQPNPAQEKPGDRSKDEQQKPLDGKADPKTAFEKTLERAKKELEKKNPPQQQNPQKDPPNKEPQQNPDQANQENPEQNNDGQKPKPKEPQKKDKDQTSKSDSSGGSGNSEGKDKGDGESEGDGQSGNQPGSNSNPNKPNKSDTTQQPGGAGEENGETGDSAQSDPKKDGTGKTQKGNPQNRGAGEDPANPGQGPKPDKANDQKNGGSQAGRNEPDKRNPGGKNAEEKNREGKANGEQPDQNPNPNGEKADGKKPVGTKPKAGEKPNGEGAKPEGNDPTDPNQDDGRGDGLKDKGKPNEENQGPGDANVGEQAKGDQQATGKEGDVEAEKDGAKGPQTKQPGEQGKDGQKGAGAGNKPPKPEKGEGEGPSTGNPGQRPEGADTKPADGEDANNNSADPNAPKSKDRPKNVEGAKYENNPKDADPKNDPDAPPDAVKPDQGGGDKPKPSATGDQTGEPKPGESPARDPKAASGNKQGAKPQDGKQPGGNQPKPSDAGQQSSPQSRKPQDGAKQEQPNGSASPDSKQDGNQTGGEKPSNQASPQAEQNASKPAEKSDGDPKSQNSDTGQPPAPSDSKKQSDTKGGQDGDRDGGGSKGGGQRSSSAGHGSPGQNTDAEDGSGKSKESGDGETANHGGDKKAGTPEQGAKPSGKTGEGTTTRPGDKQQSGQTTVQRQQPGGEGPGNGESREGLGNGNPTGGKGLSGENKAADNAPPPERPNGPTEDEANLEYAKKQTDLALEYLKDQLGKGKPDQELLDELKWTRDDMDNFVKQWERFKKQANTGDPAERKQFEQRLEDLGLRPKGTAIRGGGAQDHRNQVLKDTKRSEPPSEYGGQWRAFNSGGAKKGK